MKINRTMSISKILTNLCSIRQNIKIKSTFTDIVYNVLVKHKENCFKRHIQQTVKLRGGSIKFKNHFKQSAAPFKIYADSE